MLTATFLKVGETETATLGSLVPIMVESGELAPMYMIQIQGVHNDGTTDMTCNYMWSGTNWLDINQLFADASNVPFTQGKGFWVYNNTRGRVRFQCSGQVSESDANYPVDSEGATAIGNCFPVARTFGDVVPVAPSTVTTSFMVQIQGLNHDGTTDMTFNYMWSGSNWMNINQTFADASEEEIPVGKGLWVYNNTHSDKVSLQIAAPEL